MATTFKKLSTSSPTAVQKEGEEWKSVYVEKSVTQSPVKTQHTYDEVKSDLEKAQAWVAELEADLAEIEAKAKP